MMANKLQMRLELYALAEVDGQIQVGPIKFHFQPMEDCLREFYITNTTTNEFLGSDLSSMMFKRHCSDLDIEQAYSSLVLPGRIMKPEWHTGPWSEELALDLVDELVEAQSYRSLTNEEQYWLDHYQETA